MLGAVELVQGGSIRTFFRATGIRNRFWGSQDSHCHSSTCPMEQLLSASPAHNNTTGQTEVAHSPAAWAPQLTCLQENLSGIWMKELPRSCVTR